MPNSTTKSQNKKAMHRPTLGEQERQWLFSGLLRVPTLFGRAADRITQELFNDQENWLRIFWIVAADYFKKFQRLPNEEELRMSCNTALEQDPGALTDRDKERLNEFIATAFKFDTEVFREDKFMELLQKFLEDRLLFSLRRTISRPLVPKDISRLLMQTAERADSLTALSSGSRRSFEAISAADFATANYEITFLIERLMVVGEPMMIGGPKKSLKTSLALDLAIALTTGGFFLGRFRVVQRQRVLLCSGESAPAELRATAQRICRAAGVELGELDGLTFCPKLPLLGDENNLSEFNRFLARTGAEVLILDPAYVMIPGDDVTNLFKQGDLLRRITDICQCHGITLVLVHHLKSQRRELYKPADLDDFSYAGFAEFARQWLLVTRREEYDEDNIGVHRLWLRVGGSAGHNSLWAVDVAEGSLDDAGGRRWHVDVQRADEAREEARQRKNAAQRAAQCDQEQQKLNDDFEKVRKYLRSRPQGQTKTAIGNGAKISGRRWSKVFQTMLDRGELAQCPVKVGNKKKPIEGYRLADPETAKTGCSEPESTPLTGSAHSVESGGPPPPPTPPLYKKGGVVGGGSGQVGHGLTVVAVNGDPAEPADSSPDVTAEDDRSEARRVQPRQRPSRSGLNSPIFGRRRRQAPSA